MLKYLTKIAMDILPSVVATVIGAYIVNHYISNKAATDAPAAAVSTVDPGKATGSIPEPGVKAKGISEKGMIEKTASERPAEVKPSDVKAADAKSGETAPAEGRFHLFSHDKQKAEKAAAEKAVAKATPAPAASPVPAVAAPAVNPLAEASASPTEDHRDAAELARSALERLRDKNPESKAAEAKASEVKASEKGQAEKAQEAARAEPSRVQEQPRTVAAVPPVIRPLPPPITVSTPQPEQAASAQPSYPPYTASVRTDDPNRPTPPADIPPPPAQPPLDLRADAGAANPRDHARNMAEDMLSAAKSVFHAVIPTPSSPRVED